MWRQFLFFHNKTSYVDIVVPAYTTQWYSVKPFSIYRVVDIVKPHKGHWQRWAIKYLPNWLLLLRALRLWLLTYWLKSDLMCTQTWFSLFSTLLINEKSNTKLGNCLSSCDILINRKLSFQEIPCDTKPIMCIYMSKSGLFAELYWRSLCK